MIDLSTLVDILFKILPFAKNGFLWIIDRIKWRGLSKDARKIAFAINSFSWTNLQQTAPIINRVGQINRPEIEQIQKTWQSTDTPILLHGEAGTGKSGIAFRLGQTLANDGTPVLFIRADELSNSQDPVAIIQNRMALNIPLMDALVKLSKERTFSVIVDQLDSVAGTDLGKNFASFLKSLAGIPNIKILAVSRTYEFLNDPEISSLGFQAVESGRLAPEQSINYLSQIGITEPSQTIINLSSNLLNLSLIADVMNKPSSNTNRLIDEVDLWRQFFITIEPREGEEVADYVLRLARDVTARGERTFAVTFPNVGFRRKLISRGILIDAPGRRFSFRHEQLQDFLCAYSLLPEQPSLVQLLDEFGDNTSKGVISWLHLLYHNECPDVEWKFIDDVLGAREKLPFYSRIPVLENLKQQKDPTESSARVISKYSDDWAYHRFFFEGLENSTWIIPLNQIGLFFHSPDPIEVQPGSFKLTGWPAGEYLARFADRYEEIVIDVVRSIRTENWRVQEILVDALIKISPAAAAKLVSSVEAWLNGRFSDMLPNKLLSLADHLSEAGFVDASIQILESVITPVLSDHLGKYSKYRTDIHFRSDHFWVNEYCEKQVFKLMSLDPLGVVSAFERQLMHAIELVRQGKAENPEKWIGYYWRMDIPNRSSESLDADALDILIDGLRDGLAVVCKQNIQEGGKFLKAYLSSEHLILRRIALFILRTHGQSYPELVDQVLIRCNYLEKSEFAEEYRGLLRDQFANTSQKVKTQVIAWILAGPRDVEARANRNAQWKNREATDDDRREVKDGWVLYHLEIIRSFLSGKALDQLNKLIALYGKPDIEERPHIVSTSWGGAPSPVPADELSKKSFEELKRLFLTYVPEDSFLNPRESLARTFQGLVREDPPRYGDFAACLIDPAIRFVYIYHYLSGVREGVKDKGGKLGDSILGLCEYVVAQKTDPFEDSSARDEPGLFAAQMEVAHLLEDALHSDDPYLSRGQLDRVRFLLIALVHHPDPERREDASTSIDPFTDSLNCVRGEALHGIMHYSLYLIRQQEKLKSEKLKAVFLEPEIQAVLEEKLDLSREPSLAVHSVFGAFIPQLHFLANEWLATHLRAIFPEGEEKNSYWKAAWDAYIFASNVFPVVFKLLVPQYQRGLRLLNQPQDEQKLVGGSPNERLAQHIMFAYLAGLTDFGHENELLDLFFTNAPDPVRAKGIFWLSQVLGNDKPSAEDVLWQKCWALWQNRLNSAEAQEGSVNTEEISNYMRWLKFCPVGLDVLYPALRQTVKFLYDGFDARELISYVAEHCERFPFEAVTLLQQAILLAKQSWWAPKEEDEEKILQVAFASGNEDAKQIALEIINYRGERGDFRWKKFLV